MSFLSDWVMSSASTSATSSESRPPMTSAGHIAAPLDLVARAHEHDLAERLASRADEAGAVGDP